MADDKKKNKSRKKSKKRISTKEQKKRLIIEYIADLDNGNLKTTDIASHINLGIRQTLRYLTPELWIEALKIRREKYSKLSVVVDMALARKAANGDVAAARLFYEKFENFSNSFKHKIDVTKRTEMTFQEGIKKVRDRLNNDPEEKERLLDELKGEEG